MDVCCECIMLSDTGLCDGLITSAEESYRLWCVWVCSRNLVKEEALTNCRGAVLRQKQTNWWWDQNKVSLTDSKYDSMSRTAGHLLSTNTDLDTETRHSIWTTTRNPPIQLQRKNSVTEIRQFLNLRILTASFTNSNLEIEYTKDCTCNITSLPHMECKLC